MKKFLGVFLVPLICLGGAVGYAENRPNVNRKPFPLSPVVERSLTVYGNLSSIKIPFMEGRDFTGTGLFFGHTAWISVPASVRIEGNPKLSFSVSHSRTLSAGSTLTVTLNDAPVKSFELSTLNPERALIELEIPRELVRPENMLEFRFYALSNLQDPCQDLFNPANWALLHRDAAFEFRYLQAPILQLSDYSDAYFNRNPYFSKPLTVVLPKDPTSGELEAASLLVQYLGNQAPGTYQKLQTALGREAADKLSKSAGNLLAVGDLGRNPYAAELNSSLPAAALEKLKKNDGILLVASSPYDPSRNLCVISGVNEPALYKAAEALTYPKILKTLKGSYTVIQGDKPFPKIRRIQDKTAVTFRELGYFTTKLAGIFEDSASFSFRVPIYWQLLPGASLSILTSYSPILNPDRSILSVNINDRPVKSFKLSGSTEDRLFTVPIPNDLLKESEFFVTVTSGLDIGIRDCVKRHGEKAWVLIQDASHFHFPHRMAEQITFRNYPALFAEEFRDIPARLVVPDSPGEASLSALFHLIYGVSSALSQDAWPRFEILKASEVTPPQLSEGMVVLIGQPGENPWIRKANSFLPVEIDVESGRPLQTGVSILPQFIQNVATLELAPSPWNPQSSLMVITADQKAVLAKAGEALLDAASLANWQGNVVLFNNSGESYSNEGFLRQRGRGSAAPFLLLTVLAAAAIGAGLGFFIYRRRKKARRNPFTP